MVISNPLSTLAAGNEAIEKAQKGLERLPVDKTKLAALATASAIYEDDKADQEDEKQDVSELQKRKNFTSVN